MFNKDVSWLAPYPREVRKRIEELIADVRITEIRESLTDEDLIQAAMAYEGAIRRDIEWDYKTQRERDIWVEKFNKVSTQFLQLLNEGPCPPSWYGFPVRDYVLMELARRLNVAIPEDIDSEDFFQSMIKTNNTADSIGYDLDHAIKGYLAQIDISCKQPQTLKKPRDEKASRASFIIDLVSYTGLSTNAVALIASVLFEDDAIDDRLVRRLTPRR